MHIRRQQLIHGVARHAARQAQHLVGDGAQLEAHAGGAHALQDVRVAGEREAVPDAPRAQQQRVDEVLVGRGPALERLAAVEQERDGHARRGAPPLEGEEFRDEGLERVALGFFAHDVEA